LRAEMSASKVLLGLNPQFCFRSIKKIFAFRLGSLSDQLASL
jgi:hypothetical protein